jgi:hypothetical protein
MTQAEISGISPFFIVNHVPSSLSFYRNRLAFDDGLRGFEIKDADGYVLFFGRPR